MPVILLPITVTAFTAWLLWPTVANLLTTLTLLP